MPERSDRLSRLAATVRGVVEPLEARRLLCFGPDLPPDPTAFALAGAPSAIPWAPPAAMSAAPSSAAGIDAPLSESGLPLLHSFPGARAAVFLDFDNLHSGYTPYDTDGVPATFGPAERADIEHAWRHVSSYFSMFDLDVTTEQPPPWVPYSYSIISNSISTVGLNNGSFPSTQPTNFNPAVDARYRPTALAHEIGHSFNLGHQSAYDNRGNKVAEYFEGYDALHGALMGVDYARDVHKWFIGHPHTSPAALQDGVALIANRIRIFAGGDGFRPDDVPDHLDGAVALADEGGGRFAASGMIERPADADAYRFEWAGGAARLDLVPPTPSMLDSKLEVYAADGSLEIGRASCRGR